VADGWCWFVVREEYCWLVAGGWFVLRDKYCWLVADKPSEQGVVSILLKKRIPAYIQFHPTDTKLQPRFPRINRHMKTEKI
jgi:hypothetical protein